MLAKATSFFLGGLSCGGYRGYFDEFVREYKTPVLIEGGFSTGAGKLLRAAAREWERQGLAPHNILCSSGGERLDAVGCDALGLCFVNATSPHAPRAELPSAVERVLPLYDAYDAAVLGEQKETLAELRRFGADAVRRAGRYVTAAASLMRETEQAIAVCTDLDKARAFAGALSRRYLPMAGGPGARRIRLLSAVTGNGPCFLSDALCQAETLVILEDEYGAASDCILHVLADEALAKGHRVIACPCAVRPGHLDHLLLPELSCAFVTANRFHEEYSGNPRRIHCTRFSEKSGIRARKTRIRFNRKMAQELLSQASDALSEAGAYQAAVDDIYAQAELCDRMDALCRRAENLARGETGL